MIQTDLFFIIGTVIVLFASSMFYCTASQQRLFTKSLSNRAGMGGGVVLTVCAAMCFEYIMSLTAALFITTILLMIWLCFLPIGIALVKPRNGRR